MNHEEKYKAAQEWYKIAKEQNNQLAIEILENHFPELTESEDEKIGKDIINFVEQAIDAGYGIINKERKAKWLAWLEKQGNKKSTDNVEPKFHKGDWVVDDKTPNDVFCVIEVLEEIYKVIDIDGDDYHIPHCKADKQFHLWTIDDAKPGDILVDDHPFIFEKVDTSGHCYAYCGLNLYDEFVIESEGESGEWTWSPVHPATKEQCDLLFQKMKEADYEWDAEKLELRKIEQKPTDKVEPKFKVGDWVVNNNGEPQFSQVIARSWPDSKIKRAENNLEIFINTATLDKQYHLWSIRDAKDGDVLASSSGAFIHNGRNDGSSCPGSYCGINTLGQFKICDTNHWTGKKVYPATKEQRELLFAKMKEAGYEWDAEKKELKKIEQKPIEEVNGEDYGIDGLWHAVRILETTLGEVEGYQSDDGILEHKAAITAVKKLQTKNHLG